MYVSKSRLIAYLEDISGLTLLDRVNQYLPLLYLAWSLPVLWIVAVVTPPWQNPDEPAHMYRIAQIADGQLLGHRFGSHAGGVTDVTVMQSVAPLISVMAHGDRRVSLATLTKAGQVRWGAQAWEAFPNTATYSPVLYFPAVIGVMAGKWLGLSVVHSLIAARMLDALTSALIGTFALYLARSTRVMIGTLLVLPMTVALFAAATQDGPMIALTFVVVACVDHAISAERDFPPSTLVLMGFAVAAVVAGRPPYLPLAALPLVPVARSSRPAWLSLGVVTSFGLAWTIYVLVFVAVPMLPGVNAGAQLHYVVYHPLAIGPLAYNTLVDGYANLRMQFVGVLGWLDTVLPPWYYNTAVDILLLALASAAAGPRRRSWLALLIGLLAAGGLFFAEYLTWTRVGANEVQGVQGRYLIPLAAVLALAVPVWQPIGNLLRRPALAALLGFAAITPMIIIHALVLRYYLAP